MPVSSGNSLSPLAALAYQRPHALEWNVEVVAPEDLDPGLRVRIVTVEQRAVHVEQHAANAKSPKHHARCESRRQ